jgi:hypothetical protein
MFEGGPSCPPFFMNITSAFRLLTVFVPLTMACTVSHAQKQLVLLRGQDVKLRLYPGDEIVLKLKDSKNLKRSYVNNLLENAVVLHHDTVPFNKIERIYFKHNSRINSIGGLLVGGGATLLIIDQVNNSLIQGNDFSFDSRFTTTTAMMIAAGLPMMLIKKKSQKIGKKYRLMVASKGSAFYRPDRRTIISPYMDN